MTISNAVKKILWVTYKDIILIARSCINVTWNYSKFYIWFEFTHWSFGNQMTKIISSLLLHGVKSLTLFRLFDFYLRGGLWGLGWWRHRVAPGGCMWWWWRACWGWCCYLSCRGKCMGNCCNTEHTGPGQSRDSWGSPEDKESVRW